jgi:hypothetical protein
LCDLLLRRDLLILQDSDSDSTDGHGAIVTAPSILLHETAIPDSVEGVVLERLDLLDPRIRELARAGSVEPLQTGFRLDDAGRLVFGDIYRCSADDDLALQRATSVFIRLGTATDLRHASWGYAHALLRDCVYSSIPLRLRRAWHEKRARALIEAALGCGSSVGCAASAFITSCDSLPATVPPADLVYIAEHLYGAGLSAAAASLFLRAAFATRNFVHEAGALAARAVALDAGLPLHARLSARALLSETLFLRGASANELQAVVCGAMSLVCESMGCLSASRAEWTFPPTIELLAEPLARVRAFVAAHPIVRLADAQGYVDADPAERSLCESRSILALTLGRAVLVCEQPGPAGMPLTDALFLWSYVESLRAGKPPRFLIIEALYAAQLLHASVTLREAAEQSRGLQRMQLTSQALCAPGSMEEESGGDWLRAYSHAPEFAVFARSVLSASTEALASHYPDDRFRIVALRWLVIQTLMFTLRPSTGVESPATSIVSQCEAAADELRILLDRAGEADGADDIIGLLVVSQVGRMCTH